MRKIAIFDLDNCLSDDSWRVAKIDFGLPIQTRYDRYHDACGSDTAKNVDVVRNCTRDGFEIFYSTSRPQKVRENTREWLKANGLPTTGLWMRADGDFQSTVALKESILNSILSFGDPLNPVCPDVTEGVVHAYDDRDDVLAMYAKHGIHCHKMAIHNHDPGATELSAVAGSPAPSALLRAAADVFEERNRQYGNGYKRYGSLLMALFPEGGVPAANTSEEATRMNMIMMCLAKLQRYAHNFKTGGHKDSAKDLQVYAAMLEEHTK